MAQNLLKMTNRASTYISFFSFNSPMHQRFLKDIIPHKRNEVHQECEIPGIKEEIKKSNGGPDLMPKIILKIDTLI